MKTIDINFKILAGNLGEGWVNRNAAADALAAFESDYLYNEIRELYPNANITINVGVEYSACGQSRTQIYVDDIEHIIEIENIVAESHNDAWLLFCESDAAQELIENED